MHAAAKINITSTAQQYMICDPRMIYIKGVYLKSRSDDKMTDKQVFNVCRLGPFTQTVRVKRRKFAGHLFDFEKKINTW